MRKPSLCAGQSVISVYLGHDSRSLLEAVADRVRLATIETS